MTTQSESEIDLLADIPEAPVSVDQSDAIDISGLELELASDRREPLLACHNPITGSLIDLTNVQCVVESVIMLSAVSQALDTFHKELKKAAWKLTTGETKTRRLTAVVDGETRTLELTEAKDDWPERELGMFAAWCNAKDQPPELKAFYARCVREKPKIERSPVAKEVKKLAAEVFPEDSVLAEAKRRLLAVNKGHAHRLPSVKMQGEGLSQYEQKRFGDSEDEE